MAKIAVKGVLFRIRWLRVVFVIFANFFNFIFYFIFLFFSCVSWCSAYAFFLSHSLSTLSTICFYSDGRTRPTLLNAPIAIVTYAMLLQVRVLIGKILIAMHFLLQIGTMLAVSDV